MNNFLIKTIKISIIIFFFSGGTLFANAQIPGVGDVVSFRISPENPGPNQLVAVSIESFSIDLDRADQITWLVNGKVVARGAGIKQIQFETGDLGSRSTINVEASGLQIGSFSQSITIAPTEVDLLWEADSYVPPFYKGKALPASDGDITVIAIPQFITSSGRKLETDELIFTWKKDGKILGSDSGRGRDNIKIKGPKIFSSTVIQANVSSVGDSLQGKGIMSIQSVIPKIIFYENNPVLGMMYENAIKDTTELTEEEITVTAHPYFFSSEKRVDANFEYSWSVNGSKVNPSPDDESSIVLRQVGAGEGKASISLTLQNIDKILQSAKTSFSILFGRNNKTPFGF